MRAMVSAIPDIAWHHEVIEVLAPPRAMFRMIVSGHGIDGGRAEMELIRIVELGEDGRCVRSDVFEDEPAARAWLAAQ
jgi:hypothetical protein